MSDLPQELVDELKGMSGKSHDSSIIKLPSESLMLKKLSPTDEEKQKLFRQCLYDWPSTHEPAIATECADS